MLTQLPLLIDNLNPGAAKTYCQELTQKQKRFKVLDYITPKMFSIGKYIRNVDFQFEVDIPGQNPLVFCKLWKDGILFVAECTTEVLEIHPLFSILIVMGFKCYAKFCVFVKSQTCNCGMGDCGCEREFSAIIHPCLVRPAFSIQNLPIPDVNVSHIMRYSLAGFSQLVNVSQLITVCYQVSVKEEKYLSVPINLCELE